MVGRFRSWVGSPDFSAMTIDAATTSPHPQRSERVEIPITGMSCASCVGRVERALLETEGVEAPTVNLATGRATLTLAPGGKGMAAAIAAVEKAGYAVPIREVVLSIDRMSCASCVGRVERSLLAVPGVVNATVNLATGRARVGVATTRAIVPELAAAVAAAGYAARAVERGLD